MLAEKPSIPRPMTGGASLAAQILGVVVERLVEIAETERDDGVGKLLLDGEVLLAEGWPR
jgi:hypothetical protein